MEDSSTRSVYNDTSNRDIVRFDNPREHWVQDSDALRCYKCGKSFNLVTCRRHHCRRCGQAFCHACSQMRITLPESYGYGIEKERCCQDCTELVIEDQPTHILDDTKILLQINKRLKKELSLKIQLLERCRSLLLFIEAAGDPSATSNTIPIKKATETATNNAGKTASCFDLITREEDERDEFHDLLTRSETLLRKQMENHRLAEDKKERFACRIKELESEAISCSTLVTDLRERLQHTQSSAAAEIAALARERDSLQSLITKHKQTIREQECRILLWSTRNRELEQQYLPQNPSFASSTAAAGRVCNTHHSSYSGTTHQLTEPLLVDEVSSGCRQEPRRCFHSALVSRLLGFPFLSFCCCCKRRR